MSRLTKRLAFRLVLVMLFLGLVQAASAATMDVAGGVWSEVGEGVSERSVESAGLQGHLMCHPNVSIRKEVWDPDGGVWWDANTPTGPTLDAGSTVQWRYIVTNTGDESLKNISVWDSKGVPVSCSFPTYLTPGDSRTCTASDTAIVGQYSNIGYVTAKGRYSNKVVSDDDPCHYYGCDVTAYAPDVTLCAPYTQADLEAAVKDAGGGCDFGGASGTTKVVDNGDGTYTVYCDSQGCTDEATGKIIEIPTPTAKALDVDICAPLTQAKLEAAVAAAGGGCDYGKTTVVDNGDGTYTVYCDNQGCLDDDTGTLTVSTGDIRVVKFVDWDMDGIQDADEAFLSGWTMTLYDAQGYVMTGTTGVNGDMVFQGLECGDYAVEEALTGCWVNSTPLEQSVTVYMNEISEVWFGNYPILGDMGAKFWDLNADGYWNGGEPGKGGVKIIVRDVLTGTIVYQTTTANDGKWGITIPLRPGDYVVEEVVPGGWEQTYPEVNGGKYTIRTFTDCTYELISPMPKWYDGLNFGNARPMGYKFHDFDGSESYNPGTYPEEKLLPNWRILMKDMSFHIVLDTRTKRNGYWYLGKVLPEGDYYVFEDVYGMPGWEQTYPSGRFAWGYTIRLQADGSYSLVSQKPSWYDGLSFGNKKFMTVPDCNECPEWVVFQSDRVEDNYNIFKMRPDGTEVTQLTETLYEDIQPVWHFNAQAIAFASNRDGDWEIYWMYPDGTNETNVTNKPLAEDGVSPSNDLAPSWSCDEIAFQSDRDGNWEIYKTDVFGLEQVRLTDDPASDEQPQWSYECDEIAFQSDRSGNWDIWVMDDLGENVRQLTTSPAVDRNPSWSPDSEWIAFESDREGQFDIWKVNVNTGELVRLTDDPGDDTDPAWNPYCENIYFHTDRDADYEVYRMDEEGNGELNLSQEVQFIDVLDKMPVPNNPPEAIDDTADTPQNTTVDIDVLANGDSTIVYTPDAGFAGEDTFNYVVSDGRGGTDSATVTVLVVRRLGEDEVKICIPLVMQINYVP